MAANRTIETIQPHARQEQREKDGKFDRQMLYHSLSENFENLETRHDHLPKTECPSICYRCTKSMIVKQKSKNQPLIHCHELGVIVPDDIDACNKFSPQNKMSLFEMSQLATIIDIRDAGGHYV